MAIVVRSPFRVSFLGGGSDIPAFYDEFGDGCVVSSAISKYVYVVGTPRFERSGYSLRYSKNEEVDSIDEIQHPIIREVLREFKVPALELSVVADFPAGTGLGSSSAFTCALVSLASHMMGMRLSPPEIAEYACHIEINLLGEPIGKQDQYASALGGLNVLKFSNLGVVIEAISLEEYGLENFERQFRLVHLGLPPRSASEILKKQMSPSVSGVESRMAAVKELSILAQRVALGVLEDPSLVGKAMDEAWQLKLKSNPDAVNREIQRVLDLGTALGAKASKVLGAGGSGFALFWKPEGFTVDFDLGLAKHDLRALEYKLDLSGTKVLSND